MTDLEWVRSLFENRPNGSSGDDYFQAFQEIIGQIEERINQTELVRLCVVNTDSIGQAQSRRDPGLLVIQREWPATMHENNFTCRATDLDLATEIVRHSYRSSIVLVDEAGTILRGPQALPVPNAAGGH